METLRAIPARKTKRASTAFTAPEQSTSPIFQLSGGGSARGNPMSRQGSFCTTGSDYVMGRGDGKQMA